MYDNTQLLLSTSRALLFNIITPVRFIFIRVVNEILIMSVYCEKELTEAEKDIYYSVAGEVVGDFVRLSNSEVNLIITNDGFDAIKEEGMLVYARYET